MQFCENDTIALLDLLRWRRDVRHFKSDPISPESMEKLVQAMELAPSVGNSRPWRVVSVESSTFREKIIENYEAANRKAAARYTGERLEAYRSLKLAGLREAPTQLAVFTDPSPSAGKGLGRQTMPETLVYSTIIAVHQLWLVARTLNIGLGWVSIVDADKITALLDVDPSWQLTAYLCLGYPQFEDAMPELHRAGWQENLQERWIRR